ncbi:hypothetical protein PILCRDRAFT_45997, partial [Piloderma croceum F 1598]
SITPRLDPEYVEFHNNLVAQILPPRAMPWNPGTRYEVAMPGASVLLQVGSTKDINLRKCWIRVIALPRSPHSRGWPVFI